MQLETHHVLLIAAAVVMTISGLVAGSGKPTPDFVRGNASGAPGFLAGTHARRTAP